MLTTW
ncbi:Protein of unknown function [Weissella confusa LBAE C39-2]